MKNSRQMATFKRKGNVRTYLLCIKEIKVHNPARSGKEQRQRLLQCGQVASNRRPTWKDRRTNDSTKHNLRELDHPLHVGIDGAERPHRGESPYAGLSERQVGDTEHYRHPRKQGKICLTYSKHTAR